jgi:hypothetical protein
MVSLERIEPQRQVTVRERLAGEVRIRAKYIA